MKFIKTWRWFGPNDPVTLDHIRQLDLEGIVTSLLEIPVGEVWSADEIEKRKNMLWENAQLPWTVVESVNVHSSIKTASEDRDFYIEKYIQTIKNLSKSGIKTICYNFMPVLDWIRSHYRFVIPDGRETVKFDYHAIAAFDLFILKRPKAEYDYPEHVIVKAKQLFDNYERQEIELLQMTAMGCLPGTNKILSLSEFREGLNTFDSISVAQYKDNLHYFLKKICPVAESEGIKMAIHPDDPPFSVFGLPRIVSTHQDLADIASMYTSETNGFTFCSGSLGVNPENNLIRMITDFGSRIHFIHLRNVRRLEEKSFVEADHINGDVDMVAVIEALIHEQTKRQKSGRTDIDLPLRPDHGFKMLDDFSRETYPGYAAIGRLKGLAQLEGIEAGIRANTNPFLLLRK